MTKIQCISPVDGSVYAERDYLNELDALTSWTYNLGVGNLKSSTLLKKLNAGNKDEVPAEIVRWNKANGKVLAGLTKRREAEAELWAKEVA